MPFTDDALERDKDRIASINIHEDEERPAADPVDAPFEVADAEEDPH